MAGLHGWLRRLLLEKAPKIPKTIIISYKTADYSRPDLRAKPPDVPVADSLQAQGRLAHFWAELTARFSPGPFRVAIYLQSGDPGTVECGVRVFRKDHQGLVGGEMGIMDMIAFTAPAHLSHLYRDETKRLANALEQRLITESDWVDHEAIEAQRLGFPPDWRDYRGAFS